MSVDRQLCAALDGCGGRGVVADLVLESLSELLGSAKGDISPDSLLSAVHQANAAALQVMRSRPEVRGSGATLDILALAGTELVGVHVGDGRVYLIRDGGVQQLSKDHTMVAEMIERGEITESEAASHPRRNVIMQAMGVSSGFDPQLFSVAVRSGDVIVACTDGVWKEVGPTELITILGSAEPQRAIKTILARAVASHDNATVVVATVQ